MEDTGILPPGDMRLLPEPAQEQISAPPRLESAEPLADGAPSLLGNLELHRSARLFLDYSRSVANSASADHTIESQPDEIATLELAVDGQAEHREIPLASFQLQANTNVPTSFNFSGRFWSFSRPLFQGARRQGEMESVVIVVSDAGPVRHSAGSPSARP
jgi:hypothetical protein